MSNLTGKNIVNKVYGIGRVKWAFWHVETLCFVCQFRYGVHTVAASQCVML